jgi:hypothetical protein
VNQPPETRFWQVVVLGVRWQAAEPEGTAAVRARLLRVGRGEGQPEVFPEHWCGTVCRAGHAWWGLHSVGAVSHATSQQVIAQSLALGSSRLVTFGRYVGTRSDIPYITKATYLKNYCSRFISTVMVHYDSFNSCLR